MERILVDENPKHHRLMRAVVHLRGQSRGDGNILPATPNATNAMYGERERGDIHLVGEPVISFYALLPSFLIHFSLETTSRRMFIVQALAIVFIK